MNPAEIIVRKRDGGELTPAEIHAFIAAYSDGRLPDYQMAAMAMAILFRGMTSAETGALTQAMLDSGTRLEPIPEGPPRVDKHSTGGLGDKVSLVLAPLLACAEVHVPMISGRGLGFSGGTLDKLEAIPGFRVQLSFEESSQVLREVGCFIVAASHELVPADRRLYALRDVTGTVESIPLITASILSKKLAARLNALVMDVKVGSAAFMKTLPDATRLADSIRHTCIALGTPCRTLITEMFQPLGRAVGNAIEVNESVEVLQNRGPAEVRELTLRLSAEALVAAGIEPTVMVAIKRLESYLSDGRAYERFVQMVVAQGGQWNDKPLRVADSMVVRAERSGHLSAVDGVALGNIVIELGGGRRVITDSIDPSVGIEMLVRIGDRVEANQPLCHLLAAKGTAEPLLAKTRSAFVISDEAVERPPLFY